MTNRFVYAGHGGEVRWGYRLAASLKSWTVTTDPSGTVLTGTLVNAEPVRCAQQPLRFIAKPGWEWPVESLQIAAQSVTARLRSQE
jgi:hypothetical protein